MGALSVPKLSPVTQSKSNKQLNQYGRDPESPWERMRRSSNYDKGTGYGPFFHAFLADWGRITSGSICDRMLMVVQALSLGRTVKKGKQREEETAVITYTKVAQLVAASDRWPEMLRSIEREFARWHEAGIAEVTKVGPGKITVRLRYREWEQVKDYRSNVIPMPEPAEPKKPKEPAEPQPGHQALTKRPVTVPAGHMTKPIPITKTTVEFEYRVAGPVDLMFSAVIEESGKLVVVSQVTDDWLAKLQITSEASNRTSELSCGNGRGCRNPVSNPPSGKSPSTAPTPGKVLTGTVLLNPQSRDLIEIFDPLLKRSVTRLLSADSIALASACAEYHGLTKENLVNFLFSGSDPRASRSISSPKACAAIIREARLNYERSSSVPDVALPKGKKSKAKKSFTEDVEEVLARRIKDGTL